MRQRILVIDDERDVRECVESLLATLPETNVEGAGSYAQGAARMGEGWDLVISDFALPDGSGVDLLAASMRRNPAAPRLLMTAFSAHPEVLAAMEGATLTECIQKPFEPEDLLARVEQLLRARRPA